MRDASVGGGPAGPAPRRRALAPVLGVLVGAVGPAALQAGPDVAPTRPTFPRHPVALALDDSQERLWVANGRRGTVSLVDTRRLEVVGEFTVAVTLADLIATPGADRMLALDDTAHELLVLAAPATAAPALDVAARVPVSPYPVRLVPDEGGTRLFVTSLWSRRLDVLENPADAAPRRTHSIDLPFAPREALALGGGRLLVAAAFGGELAVVDGERGRLVRRFELPIHNVRGLARGPGAVAEVLITHQALSPYATTSRDDVFWGILIANRLLRVDLAAVLDPVGDVPRRSLGLDLGEVASAAGDPERVAVIGKGEVAVTLGGTGRVALGRVEWPRLDHVQVGRRPTAIVASRNGRLYVANTLSDSVSVIDIRSRRRLVDVSLGPVELTAADRGEAAFYDAELSLRGWMSCHSCHTDGHANGVVVDTLGDGDFGAPKRVPSLLGVAQSGPWAWNGSLSRLEEQVAQSVHSTLRSREATREQIDDLASFLRTLEPPSLPPPGTEEARRRGLAVFEASECAECHTPPTFTSARARDVGLRDEMGNRRFNPPSLRGVRYRSSFLHDGRADSLRDVFARHGHPPLEPLDEAQIDDLVAYLSSL